MDFMNMFEEMMGGLEPSKKEESKKEKKAAVKKTQAKAAPKKEKKVKVKLPVEVVSAFTQPFILDHISNEKEESELQIILTHLATQMGFKGILHNKVQALYENDKLYLAEEDSIKIMDDDARVQVEFPVTVVYGSLSAEYSVPEEISAETDEDEITVTMVAEKFKSQFPGFDTAKWSYDPESRLIIPYWSKGVALKETDVLDCPCTLYMGDEYEELSADEYLEKTGSLSVTAKDICEDKLPIPADVIKNKGNIYLVKAGKNAYRLVFSLTAGNNPVSGGGTASGAKKKKVEEKYKLPFNLIITGFSQQITDAEFPGKKKISKQELEEYLTPKYPSLFNDSSRKPSWFYCKELSSLEIVFLSGSKGCV